MFSLDVGSARVLLDYIALLLLATALGSLLIRRLDSSIHLLSAQGLLLTAAAFVIALTTGASHAYLAAVMTLLVKVLVVPGILLFALREVRIKKEMKTVISVRLALPIGIALMLVAYYSVGSLAAEDGFLTRNALPVAVSMLLIGLLNMITRKKAISQVVGIVAMENGLYLMAIIATQGLPLAVELGVAIDLIIGVLIMGVVVRQIQRTFNSINTDHLRMLRG